MPFRLLIVCIVASSAIAANPAIKPHDFEAAMEKMRWAEGSEYFRQKEAFLKQPGVDEFLISLSESERIYSDWLAQLLYDTKFQRRLILECEQGHRDLLTAVPEHPVARPGMFPEHSEYARRLLDRAGGRSFNELFDADGKFLLPPRERGFRFLAPLFGGGLVGFRAEVILKRDELSDLVKWDAVRDRLPLKGAFGDGIVEHLWRSGELWARHAIVYRCDSVGHSRTGTIFMALESDEPAIRAAARTSLALMKKRDPTGKWKGKRLARWCHDHSPEEKAALLEIVAKHWPELRARLDAALEQERQAPK